MDESTLHAWDGVIAVEPAEGGHRNTVWRGTSPAGPVAIRQSRRSPASLAWELDLIATLDRRGFTVAAVVPTRDGAASRQGIVVQHWIDGCAPSTEHHWRLVADELQRLHRSMHQHSQRPGCLATTELTRDSRSVDADFAALPAEVADQVLAVFGEFAGDSHSVIHGDPAPSNLRITDDGRVGLLDVDESRVDLVQLDLANLGVQVLSDAEHARAARLADAWEAANGWFVEPAYAAMRLAQLRRGLRK